MLRVLPLAAGLMLLAACRPPAATELSAAEVAAVRANMDAYVAAALAGDWHQWGTTLTEHIVYMPPNQPPILGRAGAVAFGEAFPKITSLNVTQEEITGRLDVAHAYGKYSFSAALPDGSAVSESGSYVSIHRRQADQTWLFSHLIWHSDSPPPAVPEPAPAPTQ